MKTTGVGQARKKTPNSCPISNAICVWLLLLLPLSLLATSAEAAKITFAPNELKAVVAPGEAVVVPVLVSLADTTAPNSYASFSLSRVDGPLDLTSINNGSYVSLNSSYKSRQVAFQIKVPANTKGGKYTNVFRTVWLRSNEQIAPVDLLINVEVGETSACIQVPLFSNISSAEEKISVRNNKEVEIDLTGRISVEDGCDYSGAWYLLTDEYGELGSTEEPLKVPVEVNDDGTFSVAIPMVASRKGHDKDGRLYTVKFMAENQAGIGESPETTVVVLHDNRKK